MSDTTPMVAPTAAKGDQLDTLIALRDRLAHELDVTRSARDVAALSRQLTEVLALIADLDNTEEEHDELADLIALPGGANAG